jgi:hypothetical protein
MKSKKIYFIEGESIIVMPEFGEPKEEGVMPKSCSMSIKLWLDKENKFGCMSVQHVIYK